MATRYWIGTGGSTAGDWDDTGNWNSAKPTTGDIAVVDDTATTAATTGLGSLTGVALSKFIVRNPGATVGTASAFAEIDADEIVVDMGASAESLYLLSEASDCEMTLTQGANASGVVQIAGEIDIGTGAQGGTFAFVKDPGYASNSIDTEVASGARVVGATITATSDVTWNGGTMAQGSVTSAANLGTWTIVGAGTLTATGTATSTVEIIGGGTYRHQSTGTITLLTARAGSYSDAGQAYTITNLSMGANADVRLGAGVTLSNAIEMLTSGRGPTVPRGTTLTVALPGA